MKIQYYGHSALGIETAGKYIIVDPFISGNPKADKINIDELKVDYILLTHAHYDHTLDVEALVKRTDAVIVANHEIVTYYKTKFDFEGIGMNQGGLWSFDFGKIHAVNAVHSSSFPDGTYGGNPLGFILESEEKTVYLAGDTDISMEMKLIPMFHRLDLAILPVGGVFTMDINRALVASDFIECNRIMGVHFDTMPVIEIDHEDAINKFKQRSKELILLSAGEIIEI